MIGQHDMEETMRPMASWGIYIQMPESMDLKEEGFLGFFDSISHTPISLV